MPRREQQKACLQVDRPPRDGCFYQRGETAEQPVPEDQEAKVLHHYVQPSWMCVGSQFKN